VSQESNYRVITKLTVFLTFLKEKSLEMSQKLHLLAEGAFVEI
jgi:hypothetical protein